MKVELLFIPAPGAGHVGSAVEMARRLVDHDDDLSVTILLIPSPYDTIASPSAQSLSATAGHRIHFVDIPSDGPEAKAEGIPVPKGFASFIESRRPHVREAASKLGARDSPRLAGFVVDMFCVAMIDVANELGVPSYIFYTSGAGFLRLQLHVLRLHDEENYDVTQLRDSEGAELHVPCLAKPVPAKCLPSVMLSKDWIGFVLGHARRFLETKGIMVNTFAELESRALMSLSEGGDTKIPTVYPVGPVVKLKSDSEDVEGSEILRWLDEQPPSSVVFLCFGSMGSFTEDQVREIAHALERTGTRFLWSLRLKSAKDPKTLSFPSETGTLDQVLPEGFLSRTAEIGKVIGWAPQTAVLAHRSIGGFVSHCGWNSTLESLWFGVPVATWPLHAEQQFNAFEMVEELGLAAEISVSYRNDFLAEEIEIVSADEIEGGIRCLMSHDTEIRSRVKDVSDKSRAALVDGGSSHAALGKFLQDIKTNMM